MLLNGSELFQRRFEDSDNVGGDDSGSREFGVVFM